ncbi:MAG: sadH [Pseudonocardiales bacterium]|nr:sadH [Pseudonocardiales bacterium]
MKELSGRVIAITGAGSGIGRALALNVARAGALLALSDVRAADVRATGAACVALGARAVTQVVDVRDFSAVQSWAAQVVAEFGTVNVIVNNAGIALTGDIEDLELSDIGEVMDVDFWGVVHGSKAFLPHLIASGEGQIVNISSVFGLVAVPSQSAYNAAKFAVRGFTEALRQEMILAGHPVGVTCVHPGGIRTDIVRNARTVGSYDHDELVTYFDQKLGRVTADKAAAVIVRGIRHNRARVLVGADAYVVDIASRLLASGYQRLITASSRRRSQRPGGSSPRSAASPSEPR